MTSVLAMRKLCALTLTLGMAGCNLVLGLDDYYPTPECPAGAALCVVCDDVTDCGPAEACHTWNCVGHLCQPINAVAGTACPAGVCSEKSPSTCIGCNVDADCDGGYCYEKACLRCDNGVKEGDETDVDCGGTHCPTCTQARACLTGNDCTSTFCTDGLCCDIACDGMCLACNVEESKGQCNFVPKYGQDQSYDSGKTCLNADGLACTGGGYCGKTIGSTCSGSADCASTKCGDPDMDLEKNCVALPGETCAANGECLSNICTIDGICQ